MKKLILLFSIGVLFSDCFSQYNLLLLDGSSIKTNWLKYNSTERLYLYHNKKGKIRYVEPEFIFSINTPGNQRQILYKPDSIISYQPDEMYSLIRGEIDAIKEFKPYKPFIIGMINGAVFTFVPYKLGINMFYSTIFPIGLNQASFFIPLSTKKLIVPNKYDPQLYKKGYILRGRKKRFIYNLLGTLTGLGITYTWYSIQLR